MPDQPPPEDAPTLVPLRFGCPLIILVLVFLWLLPVMVGLCLGFDPDWAGVSLIVFLGVFFFTAFALGSLFNGVLVAKGHQRVTRLNHPLVFGCGVMIYGVCALAFYGFFIMALFSR